MEDVRVTGDAVSTARMLRWMGEAFFPRHDRCCLGSMRSWVLTVFMSDCVLVVNMAASSGLVTLC